MADIKEIIERESVRTDPALCRKAYLYKVGSFLRAHEWSAWLFVKTGAKLKVSNNMTSAVGMAVAMVGFPPDSLGKFSPEGASVGNLIDDTVEVEFPEESFPEGCTPESLAAEFAEWKDSLPVRESKTASRDITEKSPRREQPVSMMSIIHSILHFPVSDSTPKECMDFVVLLQRQSLALVSGY